MATLGLVFLLVNLAPGDPASLALRGTPGSRGVALSPSDTAALRARFGLDRPAHVRFLYWVRDAALFDFGRSFQNGQPVRERLADTLPVTLSTNAAAVLFAVLISSSASIVSLLFPGSRLERGIAALFDLLFATPPFVLGLLLLLVLAVDLGAVPLLGGQGIEVLVLPALTLGLVAIAPLFAYFRAVLRDAFESLPATAARARGETVSGILLRSARRSGAAFIALLTSLIPSLLSGSVLVERLYSVGGSGELLAQAVLARDYPVVLGLTFYSAGVVAFASFSGDIVMAVLDPRVREIGNPSRA